MYGHVSAMYGHVWPCIGQFPLKNLSIKKLLSQKGQLRGKKERASRKNSS